MRISTQSISRIYLFLIVSAVVTLGAFADYFASTTLQDKRHEQLRVSEESLLLSESLRQCAVFYDKIVYSPTEYAATLPYIYSLDRLGGKGNLPNHLVKFIASSLVASIEKIENPENFDHITNQQLIHPSIELMFESKELQFDSLDSEALHFVWAWGLIDSKVDFDTALDPNKDSPKLIRSTGDISLAEAYFSRLLFDYGKHTFEDEFSDNELRELFESTTSSSITATRGANGIEKYRKDLQDYVSELGKNIVTHRSLTIIGLNIPTLGWSLEATFMIILYILLFIPIQWYVIVMVNQFRERLQSATETTNEWSWIAISGISLDTGFQKTLSYLYLVFPAIVQIWAIWWISEYPPQFLHIDARRPFFWMIFSSLTFVSLAYTWVCITAVKFAAILVNNVSTSLDGLIEGTKNPIARASWRILKFTSIPRQDVVETPQDEGDNNQSTPDT